MTAKVAIDKAGRLVLPKAVRDRLRLSPGDSLILESEDERITLRPERPQATLKKKRGIWVYHGKHSSLPLPEWIDQEREKRLREIIG
jgi:AbrB family looped-hinge helix DNA binding protein